MKSIYSYDELALTEINLTIKTKDFFSYRTIFLKSYFVVAVSMGNALSQNKTR